MVLLLLVSLPQAQGTSPAAPLTLVSREGRRTIPTTLLSGQELIGLDDLATLFQVSVREDNLAGGVTVTYRGRTIVASLDQPMASVSGRVVTLPSPVVRLGRRAFVPIEFLPRALAPIYDQRIDLRRPSRLLILGDVRVPRVTARIDAPGPPTRATIEVNPNAGVTLGIDPARVSVRIEADALDLALPPMGSGLIEQIRPGDQPNTITVMLAAGAGVARAVAATADNITRIAIDVPGAATAAPEPAAPPAPAPPPPSATALLGTPRVAVQTIVIDPGHGGDDIGARGTGGAQEKQLTLDVARRLRGLIESRLGLRVVLTRDDDRAVALDERAAIANNGKADLFLSLHTNAALAPAVSGVEVYYLRLDPEGEKARREAAADAVMLPSVSGGNRTIDVIRWDLAQARHIAASATLAGLLAEELKAHVPVSSRPIQQAPLRVLEGADMPAALIEMLYLTNPDQEKAAGREDFRNQLAQSIYDAVARFREQAEEAKP